MEQFKEYGTADGTQRRVRLGNHFSRALCEHFGIPTSKVLAGMEVNAAQDDVFGVTLKVALSPDDLAAIAERMKGL